MPGIRPSRWRDSTGRGSRATPEDSAKSGVDIMRLILAVAVLRADVQNRDGAETVLGSLKASSCWVREVWADGADADRSEAAKAIRRSSMAGCRPGFTIAGTALYGSIADHPL